MVCIIIMCQRCNDFERERERARMYHPIQTCMYTLQCNATECDTHVCISVHPSATIVGAIVIVVDVVVIFNRRQSPWRCCARVLNMHMLYYCIRPAVMLTHARATEKWEGGGTKVPNDTHVKKNIEIQLKKKSSENDLATISRGFLNHFHYTTRGREYTSVRVSNRDLIRTFSIFEDEQLLNCKRISKYNMFVINEKKYNLYKNSRNKLHYNRTFTE